MENWKFRLRGRRKRTGFNPDSEYIAEAIREYLRNDGKITRLKSDADNLGKFHYVEDDIDFTLDGL